MNPHNYPDTTGDDWGSGNTFTTIVLTSASTATATLEFKTGYSDSWPETGDAPPPWLRPALPLLTSRPRAPRRLPSTLPCRRRQSPIPGT